ncbi:MAG: metallophosphoesterase [Actinobacteria bacterium]|nr:metallophosphoesterase [Actinomycetota bacterium]
MSGKSLRAALLGAALLLLGQACNAGGDFNTDHPSKSAHPVVRPRFGFVVIGDFGTGEASEHDVARVVHNWAQSHPVDALLTTGDNVYDSGNPRAFDDAWRRPYGWVEDSNLSVIAALGNHDIRTDGGAPVMDLLEMPHRWYSRRVGNAEVFVLDANEPELPDQLAWLQASLARSDATWKIVVFHQPAYSCSHHDGEPSIVERWVPIFEQGGVDLVLSGHDHNYQRFEGADDIAYVVTGGGGNATLYGLDACPEETPERVVANDEFHHFVAIEGSAQRLRLRAIAPDGSIIDDFSARADR